MWRRLSALHKNQLTVVLVTHKENRVNGLGYREESMPREPTD